MAATASTAAGAGALPEVAVKLASNSYGKSRNRVVKVSKQGSHHRVQQLEVDVLLTGALDAAYLTGDNGPVVPTDTCKNICYVTALQNEFSSIEQYALLVAAYFIANYKHIESAEINVRETVWDRMPVDGKPHEHSFVRRTEETPTARVVHRRGAAAPELSGGVRDLVILKTTGSGFRGFPRCALTTLPEVSDRLMCTSVTGDWTFASPQAVADGSVCPNAVRAAVKEQLFRQFALEFSKSVQETMYLAAVRALAAAPAIVDMRFNMPNKHFWLYDFDKFKNPAIKHTPQVAVLYPTDDPFGNINCFVRRTSAVSAATAKL